MRKKRKRKLNKFALGGALIGGALFIFYLSGVLFVCKQDGEQLVKNNPALIFPFLRDKLSVITDPVFDREARGPNRPMLYWAQRFAKDKLEKLGRGIEGIQQAVLTRKVFAYDQQNTHPALTDEAVDFHNLNFSDNQLSQEDKAFLIRGAVEEDTPPRWLNHFYDPVYNKGWLGYTTSKEWAISSTTQQAFTDSAYSYGGFANLFSDNLSPTDFSYERALHDYASGNRKRAMLAMGHVLHLLEDSNVPEHTRGDTHLPWHGTESPYEKTMAKWNPSNIEIAQELFKNSAKPVLLGNLADYFDEIAKYSNGYFFSQDTINNDRYDRPELTKLDKYLVNGKERLFIIGTDKSGKEFKLALAGTEIRRNLIEIKEATLISPEIGTQIIDDYWVRLSTDFVAHGAGALKLFLEQAESVKQKYAEIQENSEPYSSWFGNFLSFLGFPQSEGQRPVTFDPNLIEVIISQPKVLGVLTDATNDISNDVADSTNDVNDDSDTLNDVSNDVASSPTPLATLIVTPEVEPPQEAQPQDAGTPTPSPLFYGGSGGSGGGSNNNPTPLPSISSTPTPTPEVEPPQEAQPQETPTPTPAETPEITPEVEPPVEVQPLRRVIINEIVWMGTGGTATLSSDEWLELYNPTSLPVDVGGWRLVSLTDNSPNIILASRTIEPYSFFLLERTNDDTISDISADQIYTGNLNDGGEVLELRDNSDNLQDLVSKSDDGGWYEGDKTTRSSMERINPLESGDNQQNWTTNNGLIRNGKNAAGDFINGTPKAKNSIYVSQKPSAVSDLSVDLMSSFFDKIKLFWSAPKDDDTPAAGLKYQISYSANDLNIGGNWGNAAIAADFSVPKPVADFGRLQSASFSLFDFSGWVPPDYKIVSFSFSVNPKIAIDCRDIKAVGWYRDLPHPNDDLVAIYNTDTAEFRTHFSSSSGQSICSRSSELPKGHYSAVIEHGSGCHTNYDRYIYIPYHDCKNSSAFEGEVLFTVSDREFVYGQPYYFAIKTFDGEQWSDISNIAKHQAKPAVSTTPSGFIGPANPRITWEFNVPDAFGLGQPAVAPDGTVYFGAPNNLTNKPRMYSISPDGIEKWHWESQYPEPSIPAVSNDGSVYFGQFDPGSRVTALNPDGSQRWQFDAGDRVNNVSVDPRGNVYFTSENRMITKVKPNGEAKWQILNPFTFNFLPIADVSTGQADQDKDVYLAADAAGLPGFYRLNGEDGSTVWQSRADDNFIYYTFDPTYDPSQDKFYAPTTNYGQILTINRRDGAITKNIVDMQGGPTTKVAVLNDLLVFGMDFGLNRPASGAMVYAVNKADKSVIWTFVVDSPINRQIAVDANENLYFSTRSSKVYSIDKNGQERWVIDLGVETYIYPILWDNTVFMGIGGGEGAKLLKISD